jgi:hypothetical protein
MGLVIARVKATPVNLILFVTYTPLDEEMLAINLSYTFQKSGIPVWDWILPHAVMRDSNEDYARDIPIWEKKIYLERPLLARGDGPIMKLRSWAKQFYPQADAARDAVHLSVVA